MTIYFIGAGGHKEAKPRYVKIGVTGRSVLKRMKEAQGMCPLPLSVLALIPGGTHAKERALHVRFNKLHIHGEWFYLEPPIWDYIQRETTPIGTHRFFDLRPVINSSRIPCI